jgi:hypothetical protein
MAFFLFSSNLFQLSMNGDRAPAAEGQRYAVSLMIVKCNSCGCENEFAHHICTTLVSGLKVSFTTMPAI